LNTKLGVVSRLSGVSSSALDNWFNGDTKKPQHASIAAVATSVGYEIVFRREGNKPLDVEAGLEAAKKWRAKQLELIPPKTRRKKKK
jgi:transcriptional regulator with XRE-family HTH domain